jgi:hypothetical protein
MAGNLEACFLALCMPYGSIPLNINKTHTLEPVLLICFTLVVCHSNSISPQKGQIAGIRQNDPRPLSSRMMTQVGSQPPHQQSTTTVSSNLCSNKRTNEIWYRGLCSLQFLCPAAPNPISEATSCNERTIRFTVLSYHSPVAQRRFDQMPQRAFNRQFSYSHHDAAYTWDI